MHSSLLSALLVLPSAGAAPQGHEATARLTCRDRTPCYVAHVFDAGRTQGTALSVAEVVLAKSLAVDWKAPRSLEACIPYEYWVVRTQADGTQDAHPLVRLCNDGYGARHLGEDRVVVTTNRFTHTQVGGSAWMWEETKTVRLHPLMQTAQSRRDWWTLGEIHRHESWRWCSLAGFVSGQTKLCDSHEEAEHGGPALTYAYQPIPRVSLDEAFRARHWRTHELGSCAMSIDSRGGATDTSPSRGFVVHGQPSSPKDARMKVLLSMDQELFIELHDDHWVEKAPSWIHADHLEIWLGDEPRGGPQCWARDGHLVQWGIGLDGTVYPAYGQPQHAPKVDVARAPKGKISKPIRFKIRLPTDRMPIHGDSWRITVVYSDSDDGQRQERMISTSQWRFGKHTSLGRVRDVRKTEAQCVVDKERLQVRIHKGRHGQEPILH